ncbi:MAG: response regulator transcription factor [bacterium]
MSLILIIDDDRRLCELLTDYLARFGHKVITSAAPETGLVMLKERQPELVILDIMLPGMDGFEVCKRVRKDSTVPIIMLTARGDVMDRVVGLEIGADDYMPKPFEPRELAARIQTVLRRRTRRDEPEIISFKGLYVNKTNQEVLLDGRKIELTSMEFNLLYLFTQKPGRVFDRDQIMDNIKGMDFEAFDRSIDVAMSRLRKKIGDNAKMPRFFKTVRGTGYVFVGENNDVP